MFNPGRAVRCSRFLTFVRNDKGGVRKDKEGVRKDTEGDWNGKERVWNDTTIDAGQESHALSPIWTSNNSSPQSTGPS